MAEAAEYPVPFSQMTLVDWLDDLTVRFLLNLPAAELSSVPRLCFQVEEAQWFYEDFIRPANPQLPSLNLRQFCMTLFQHCPLLSGFDAAQHLAAYEEFLAYKVRVPVRGAIMMDDTMEKVLLVRGWKKGASWSFPRGKINKNEKDIDCAIREVYEETGYDINAAGLVQLNEENGQVKAIDVTMREQHMKLFVFRGVPLDSYFEPKTRKEISKIQWYNVKDLPGFKKNKGGPASGPGEMHANKFYMVAPFLGHLKKWIAHQKKKDAAGSQLQYQRNISAVNTFAAGVTEDEGDTEADAAFEHGITVPTPSAEGLKRLLSISPIQADAVMTAQEAQTRSQLGGQPNLLAVLQGGLISDHPRTTASLDQNVNPLLSQHRDDRTQIGGEGQTTTPLQPQHLTFHQVSSPPHYSQIHQQQQQQQQYHQVPLPAAGLPTASSASSNFTHTYPGQDVLPSMANAPGVFSPVFPQNPAFVAQNRGNQAPFDLFPSQKRPQSLQPPANLLAAFSPQQSANPSDLLVKGPRAPEASKLPAPKLNAHSMKLLDAFKSTKGIRPAVDANNLDNTTPQKASNQQQAALLNLFRQGQKTEHASPGNSTATASVQPTTAPLQEQTSDHLQRGPTANEITSTLPFHARLKSPNPQELATEVESTERSQVQAKPQESIQAASPQRASRETQSRSHHASPRQRAVSDKPQNVINKAVTSTHSRKSGPGSPVLPISILPRPSSRLADGQSNFANKKAPHGNLSPTPQFSILQRPASSSSKGPRPPVPQSPLRHDSNLMPSQPQVLRRPADRLGDDAVPGVDSQSEVSALPGKTDQLLALFGKTPTTTSNTQQNIPVTSETEPRANPQQRDMLLNLFNAGSVQRKISPVTATPPPAPQLVPERNPSRPSNNARQQNQQHLANLISVQNSGPVGSPSTPISPFTLGTPIAKLLPSMQQLSEGPVEARSRIGSVASLASNGTNSGRQTPTPSSVTPTEAKGVLLDYLNGVVKEGYRGAKRA